MQKIINRILFSVVLLLIFLLVFRSLRPQVQPITASNVTTQDQSHIDAEHKEKIELIVKDFILNNPEVIMTSMDQLQKRHMQEKEGKAEVIIKDTLHEAESTSLLPIIGNKDGSIVIVSFYDYNCSYCRVGNHNLNELVKSNSKVKVILRPLPILGETSTYIARIILAINKTYPDKFQQIHNALGELNPISKEGIDKILTSNSLKINEVEEIANGSAITQLIEKNYELAKKLSINGTPAYIVNDKLIHGLLGVSELEKIIEETQKSDSKDADPSKALAPELHPETHINEQEQNNSNAL